MLTWGLVFGGMTVYRLYIKSFTPHNKQGVNLVDWQPFNSTKLATLDSPASIQLPENDINIDGATAFYPLYAAFVQATFPPPKHEGRYSPKRWQGDGIITSNPSPEAFRNLVNGRANLLFSLAPSHAQEQAAKERNLSFVMTPIGKEAFIFFVNKNNPINNLSSDQIRAIYSGKLTRWNEIEGGRSIPILAYQRNAGSGSQTAFERVMAAHRIMEPQKESESWGMGTIVERVADYRNFDGALGFSFRYYASEMVKNDQIKFLSIDGIAPTKENIRNGTYPFIYEFYAITIRERSPLHNVQRLINWILSEEGQTLVERTGYVPIR